MVELQSLDGNMSIADPHSLSQCDQSNQPSNKHPDMSVYVAIYYSGLVYSYQQWVLRFVISV